MTKKQKESLKKSRIGTLITDWVAYYKKAKKKGLDLHIGEGAEPTAPKAPLCAFRATSAVRVSNAPFFLCANSVDRLYDLPDIEEIFEDDSMFLAFREYLYRRFANENLTFWIETELFRHLPTEPERKKRSKEIWDKFCMPESPMPVNIDFNARKLIQGGLPSSGAGIFREAERVTWKVLKNEWFPEFCASDVFHELNEGDGVEFQRSNVTRERGNTVDLYHELVDVKSAIETAGRDFVKEINEEPEHWGKHKDSVPKIKAPPISPKFAKENPWESPRDGKTSPKESSKHKDKESRRESPRDKDSPREGKKDKSPREPKADNGGDDEPKKSSRRKDKEKDQDKDKEKEKEKHKDKEKRHKSSDQSEPDAEKEPKHKDKSRDKHKEKEKSKDKN